MIATVVLLAAAQASTTIGVSSLVMTGGLIEIEVTAFKQDQLVRQ